MAAIELYSTPLISDANLQAYYRFISGALTTDSKGSNTLTAIGSPSEDASGKFAGAVAYASASSQGHSIVNASALRPSGNFSISFWIKTSWGTGQFGGIFCNTNFSVNVAGYYVAFQEEKKILFMSGRNTGTTANTDYKTLTSASTSFADGNWHHIVCVYDGSYLRIYLDGSQDNSVAWANNAGYAATMYPRIGCRNTGGGNGNYFNGSLDDIALFDRALSSTEVSNLYNGNYTSIKTILGLAKASVKTVNGLAIASVKTWNGLA